MTSPTGGRWIFSVDTASGFSGLILGINNGVAPVFPAPVAGKFNGLFYETNQPPGVRHGASGFFTLTLTDRGTYTASLLSGSRARLSARYQVRSQHGGASPG